MRGMVDDFKGMALALALAGMNGSFTHLGGMGR